MAYRFIFGYTDSSMGIPFARYSISHPANNMVVPPDWVCQYYIMTPNPKTKQLHVDNRNYTLVKYKTHLLMVPGSARMFPVVTILANRTITTTTTSSSSSSSRILEHNLLPAFSCIADYKFPDLSCPISGISCTPFCWTSPELGTVSHPCHFSPILFHTHFHLLPSIYLQLELIQLLLQLINLFQDGPLPHKQMLIEVLYYLTGSLGSLASSLGLLFAGFPILNQFRPCVLHRCDKNKQPTNTPTKSGARFWFVHGLTNQPKLVRSILFELEIATNQQTNEPLLVRCDQSDRIKSNNQQGCNNKRSDTKQTTSQRTNLPILVRSRKQQTNRPTQKGANNVNSNHKSTAAITNQQTNKPK